MRPSKTVFTGYREYLLIFVVIWIALILIYRDFIYDIPRRDQIQFIQNLIIGTDDFDFFIQSLSYSRTRIIGAGDYYLFRPLMTGVLSLQEIFLHDSPVARGLLGFVISASAYSAIYMLVRVYVGPIVSLAIVATMVTNVAGFEMVTWRHITPYFLSITFVSLALWMLQKPSSKTSVIVVMLMIGMGFHDVFSFVALGFGLICWMTSLIFRDPLIHRSTRAFLISSVLFLLLNAADYFYYGAPSIIGSADKFSSLTSWYHAPIDLLTVFSASVLASWFGPVISINKLGSSYLAIWDYTESGVWLIVGCATGLALICLFFLLVREKKINRNTSAAVVGAFSLSAIFVLISLLVIGRVVPRGVGYLIESPYYFALIGPFWGVLLATIVSMICGHRNIKYLVCIVLFSVSAFQLVNLYHAQSVVTGWMESHGRAQEDMVSEIREHALSSRTKFRAQVEVTSLQKPGILGPENLFLAIPPGWHAGSPPSFPEAITITFDRVVQFRHIGLLPQEEHVERAPNALGIEVSLDGKEWVPVSFKSTGCVDHSDQWRIVTLATPQKVKHLRLKIFSTCDPRSTLLTLQGLKLFE